MNKSLLIIGAGIYSTVAFDVAESMNFFDKIDFADDQAVSTPDGKPVVGKISEIKSLSAEYEYAFVAIGNPKIRLTLINKLEDETSLKVWSLVSPQAYVSPSAQIYKGTIVEPMAVIHAKSVIMTGCIISAGAVVNHASVLCDGVHVDCNATVGGTALVPAGTKIFSGEYFVCGVTGQNVSFSDMKK